MAKAVATKKVLYHAWFEGDNVGEADGFFEIKDGKLTLVTCWNANDASWREEYMSGLLEWAGVELKDLPENRKKEAEKLLEKAWGLDYDQEEESEHEREEASLEYRDGNSDKVYDLSLFENEDGWVVEAVYGRRGANPQHQVKCEGEDYETAKKLYDKTLNEKLKKGYEHA